MFNLVEELNRRHISLEKAAEKSGIDLDRLKQIVAGQSLTLHELRTLSKKLNIPLRQSSSTKNNQFEFEVLFRKTLGKNDQNTDLLISALSKDIASVVDLARRLPSNIAWADSFHDLTREGASVEGLARHFRDKFFNGDQDGPILSLSEVLAEILKINFLVVPKLPIEGASVLYEQQAFVFLAPRKFKARMLFTLAHELGHFVADHHAQDGNFATFDSEDELKPWKRQTRGVEEFANAFASSLLLPADSVPIVLKEIRNKFDVRGPLGDIEISYLARFFGVSFEVAGRRCENLGLLPDFGARALYEKICDEYKNPEKRADEAGLPPRDPIRFSPSTRLTTEAARRIRAGDISIGRASETLHVSLSDLFHANAETRE